MTQTRTCTTCKIKKPLSEFRRSSESYDGRQSKCKACEKAKEERLKAEEKEYGKKFFTF
jgi:hypothetical protein